MTKYIESPLDKIEADLIARYPNRAALFEEAFKAHRLEMYASSISILLSQADGLCIDSFGQKFFSMETVKGGVKQPKTKKIIQAYGASVLQQMMLEPVLSGSGMGAGEKEQGCYSDSPNRHTVVHGIDTTYPSKMNSAKAASLVAYLGSTHSKDHRRDEVKIRVGMIKPDAWSVYIRINPEMRSTGRDKNPVPASVGPWAI